MNSYRDLSNCCLYYIMTRLNYHGHIIRLSLKIWAWLQSGHTHIFDIAPRAPLLKLLEITPAAFLKESRLVYYMTIPQKTSTQVETGFNLGNDFAVQTGL